jgi:hypothetical protein
VLEAKREISAAKKHEDEAKLKAARSDGYKEGYEVGLYEGNVSGHSTGHAIGFAKGMEAAKVKDSSSGSAFLRGYQNGANLKALIATTMSVSQANQVRNERERIIIMNMHILIVYLDNITYVWFDLIFHHITNHGCALSNTGDGEGMCFVG